MRVAAATLFCYIFNRNRVFLLHLQQFLELPLEFVDIKDSNVQLIIPENYKSYILNSSEWDDQINKIIYKYEE